MRSTPCTQNTPQWPCAFQLRGILDSGLAILFPFSNLLRLNDCKGILCNIPKRETRWITEENGSGSMITHRKQTRAQKQLEWSSGVAKRGYRIHDCRNHGTYHRFLPNEPISPYFLKRTQKEKCAFFSTNKGTLFEFSKKALNLIFTLVFW